MELKVLDENQVISEDIICAIGEFDGIHLGHQKLIDKLINIKKEKKLKAGIITFDPSPKEIYDQNNSYKYLMTLNDKIDYFQNYDLDYLLIIPFSKAIMEKSAESFVKEYLLKQNIKEIVVGFDFTFGFQGKGKPLDIVKYSHKKITVHIIDEVKMACQKISSTLIKKLLEGGKVEQANQYLGHFWSLSGIVIKGKQLGRKYGFPTANIHLSDRYVNLKQGVYGVKVQYQGQWYYGMANYGCNPSFNLQAKPLLEIHLFSFKEDLYGKKIIINLLFFVREEIKFSNFEDFYRQLQKDQIFILDKVSKVHL